MKATLLFSLLPTVFMVISVNLQAQQGTMTASASGSGEGGAISWSVGQVIYHQWTNDHGSLLEGVQQPFEIQYMPGFGELPEIGIRCSLYPNPATLYVMLEIEEKEMAHLTYHIHDLRGQLLKEDVITQTATVIPVDGMKESLYFITIFRDNKPLTSCKLIVK